MAIEQSFDTLVIYISLANELGFMLLSNTPPVWSRQHPLTSGAFNTLYCHECIQVMHAWCPFLLMKRFTKSASALHYSFLVFPYGLLAVWIC